LGYLEKDGKETKKTQLQGFPSIEEFRGGVSVQDRKTDIPSLFLIVGRALPTVTVLPATSFRGNKPCVTFSVSLCPSKFPFQDIDLFQKKDQKKIYFLK
jgi:hypothetical protein